MGVETFKQAMRRVTGAVTVVTTRGVNGERRGVTATAVCSLSVSPPAVIACINRETWVGQLAPASRIFCVNVLSRAQSAVAEAFAGRTGHVAEDRFSVGDWSAHDSGTPALRDAIANFDCRLERSVDFASHIVLIGEVVHTIIGPPHTQPLLYFDGAFTTTAPSA
jgi:flavin reductase (DIM6/NTAB) family NADH-FMN oxidoreductase RutF